MATLGLLSYSTTPARPCNYTKARPASTSSRSRLAEPPTTAVTSLVVRALSLFSSSLAPLAGPRAHERCPPSATVAASFESSFEASLPSPRFADIQLRDLKATGPPIDSALPAAPSDKKNGQTVSANSTSIPLPPTDPNAQVAVHRSPTGLSHRRSAVHRFILRPRCARASPESASVVSRRHISSAAGRPKQARQRSTAAWREYWV
ncbi:hypothetical protein BROUX41_002369 [Berkeleyomyces rouxiae]|uniref:uncharacterized protein n=1 Tax=Berkeleyomyces rouxiae TaxID=2035830 RepID=UPI003B78300C